MMNQYYLDNNLRLNELDVSSFKVIFPNKNYIKKSPVTSGNVVSDEDYFVIKLHKNLPMNITKSTHDKVQKLFDKFSYQYDFKWEDVAEIFNVKKSRASEIVALLLDSNLIEPSNPTKYRFKK